MKLLEGAYRRSLQEPMSESLQEIRKQLPIRYKVRVVLESPKKRSVDLTLRGCPTLRRRAVPWGNKALRSTLTLSPAKVDRCTKKIPGQSTQPTLQKTT